MTRYNNNKDAINEKRRTVTFTCERSKIIRHTEKYRHSKSKVHNSIYGDK
jgi:hypothetical protein